MDAESGGTVGKKTYTLQEGNIWQQLTSSAEGIPAYRSYLTSTSDKTRWAVMFVQMGDANSDGKVDIADATAIINYINNVDSPTFNRKVADANRDGVIDIGDVTAVINIINR